MRIEGEADEVYHAFEGRLTSSMMKVAMKSAHEFVAKFVTNEYPESKRQDHFIIGHVFEALLVTPAKDWDSLVAIQPKVDKRTKVGKEKWKKFAEEAGDKWVISEDDAAMLRSMVAGVSANPIANKLFREKWTTQTVFRSEYKQDKVLQCKCDLLIDSMEDDIPELGIEKGMKVVVDIKSTRNPLDNFLYDVIDWRYDIQQAWYEQIMSRCGEPADRFVFLASTKVWPYNCIVFSLPEEVIIVSKKKIVEMLPKVLKWMSGNYPPLPAYRNLNISEYSLKKMGLIEREVSES